MIQFIILKLQILNEILSTIAFVKNNLFFILSVPTTILNGFNIVHLKLSRSKTVSPTNVAILYSRERDHVSLKQSTLLVASASRI